ncbi:hypothetical protein BH708_09345 [Brachybacterium sp. P6-10-X1]|uniref:hypothetical protein n=1 Tax=Brachybacterium sp. P6-10-X1 TaxID=1903186 RepID=UPI0009719FF0|nr:hypothetical protein [Brachybacterium sp. P6-10-X1]APX32887.1 hypothetical protein BH708_09345 [Brachybacterium sp. P6-10-X1]
MHALARRRATGYLLDCTGYLGIAAAIIPLGLAVNALTDLGSHRSYAYAVSAVHPAIATVVAARAESGPSRATWGKRRRGLQVKDLRGAAVDEAPIPLPRALLRNTVKIFVPWQLGHVTAVGAAYGDFETLRPATVVASVLTYGVIGTFALTGLRGTGRGPHDLVAGTLVVSAAATPPRP